jgi:hypothetical protein
VVITREMPLNGKVMPERVRTALAKQEGWEICGATAKKGRWQIFAPVLPCPRIRRWGRRAKTGQTQWISVYY